MISENNLLILEFCIASAVKAYRTINNVHCNIFLFLNVGG